MLPISPSAQVQLMDQRVPRMRPKYQSTIGYPDCRVSPKSSQARRALERNLVQSCLIRASESGGRRYDSWGRFILQLRAKLIRIADE